MKIVILGASGSIGRQTIDLIKNKKNIDLEGFSVGNNVNFAINILNTFNIKYAYIKSKKECLKIKNNYPSVHFFYGKNGINKLIKKSNSDIYINALAGFIGAIPSLKIIKKNKILCLANKESLVTLGDIINKELQKHKKSYIIPIDSEHTALDKCINYINNRNKIKKFIITASGGAFFDKNINQLENVSIEDALNHPNWKMGKKITIDSATMINKAFEIIEAHYLFDIKKEDIEVLIDRKSFVHAMLLLKNNQYAINYGPSIPSMKGPINYSLSLKKDLFDGDIIRIINYDELEKFNLNKLDSNRFNMIKYGYLVIEKKGNLGAIFNACSEVAVSAFLDNEIRFIDIEKIVDRIMNTFRFIENPNIYDIRRTDHKVRIETLKLIERGDYR